MIKYILVACMAAGSICMAKTDVKAFSGEIVLLQVGGNTPVLTKDVLWKAAQVSTVPFGVLLSGYKKGKVRVEKGVDGYLVRVDDGGGGSVLITVEDIF